jgi:hypothetical protein
MPAIYAKTDGSVAGIRQANIRRSCLCKNNRLLSAPKDFVGPFSHRRRATQPACNWLTRTSFEALPSSYSEREITMPISISTIIVSAQLVVAVADNVPRFDIARSCKLDVAATAGLAVDQPIKNCINDEKRARRQLANQWSKFPSSSRASCTANENVGPPSYVDLLTCLQMNQWAR